MALIFTFENFCKNLEKMTKTISDKCFIEKQTSSYILLAN